MNKVDIVQKAVLSVDKKYLNERYSGEINIPFGLAYGEGLTDRYKKRVRRVCGKGYPGGEIAVVIDHSLFHNFGDGYLFTDKGFYATKGNFTDANAFRKQGIPPLAYEDVVSVEVVKIRDQYQYICVRTADSEYIGFASIYAPYFCETIKKILHDLYDTPVSLTQYQIKKQEGVAKKAKAAQEKKAKETEPTKEIIDILWEEAMAMSEKQPQSQSSSVEQTQNKETASAERTAKQVAVPTEMPRSAEPIVPKIKYKAQIRMISDGSADHKAVALWQKLQETESESFTVTEFTSTAETIKMLQTYPSADLLLIYTDIIQFGYEKIEEQLLRLKHSEDLKIIVYFDGAFFDDDEVVELIESEIEELCDMVDISRDNLFFIRCYGDTLGEDYVNELIYTLKRECSIPQIADNRL